MKYYKLTMDMDRPNDVICHYSEDFGISLNAFNIGKKYDGWTGEFEFFYDESEGSIVTDYLANDKGWFLVSDRLRMVLEKVETDVQFLDVRIRSKNGMLINGHYFIANILKVVDALCLSKSEYFTTDVKGIGTVYTVRKYGIYEQRTDNADVFKLSQRQEIPIFVSERFKSAIEEKGMTGLAFKEINVC